MKKCNKCLGIKEDDEFGKNKRMVDGLRATCKQCRNSALRTGKPNLGRFQKGHQGVHHFEKGQIPWNKGIRFEFLPGHHPQKGKTPPEKELERLRRYNEEKEKKSKSRSCKKSREWSRKVRDRDGNKCVKCGSTYRLAAHHIIPWAKREDLRFDLDNGLTLCCSCHAKLEGFQIGHPRMN